MSNFGFQMASPPPRRRPLWHFVVAVLTPILLFGLFLLRVFGGPADFEPGTQGAPAAFTIESGASLRVIGGVLADAGIVASTDAFVQASEANPKARFITPGDYKLPSHIPAATAITMLLSGEARNEIRIVVPEGVRVAQVVKIVAKALGVDTAAVQEAVAATALPDSANGKPEGYLFPATYSVKRSATPREVIDLMVARFRQAAVDLELERRARAVQLPVHDVMVIASIVEQESAPADFSKVVRVILNRLRIGMALQLDSTVNYGLGIKELSLSQGQLDKDTPFNTYLREGLPPTPINNPGSAAIEAVLSPAVGDWLYFVTTDPKRKVTEFATSYEQFLALKAKFKRNS